MSLSHVQLVSEETEVERYYCVLSLVNWPKHVKSFFFFLLYNLELRHVLQADCDFTVKLVHASAADLDLERLGATNIKKPSTKYDNPLLSSCVWSSAHAATSCHVLD